VLVSSDDVASVEYGVGRDAVEEEADFCLCVDWVGVEPCVESVDVDSCDACVSAFGAAFGSGCS
jgi:hypothetical protein